MDNHVLIINYSSMKMGGIEKTFSRLMINALDNGSRVIWLTTKKAIDQAFFKNISQNDRIEKVIYKKNSWSRHTKVKLTNENVTMISCEPLLFIRGEMLRKQYKGANFNHFLLLPHFTGNAYYPERYFKNAKVNAFVYNWFKKLAQKLVNNNSIYAFSLQHLKSYEENYKISVNDINDKVLKSIFPLKPLDKQQLLVKAQTRKNDFTIISCSRWDFPHKGYILGLIDEFPQIKASYPFCKLIIVGDGPGKEELMQKYINLSEDVKASICFPGMLSPTELESYLLCSHVNIGVAGALSVGAGLGVPSLNMRHYQNSCETYGFVGDDTASGLKTSQGRAILPYLCYLLDCSDEEYVERCQKDYNYRVKSYNYHPNYMFEQQNTRPYISVTKREVWVARVLWYLSEIKQALGHATGYGIEQ